MATCARIILEKTISIIFGHHHILTRLLQGSGDSPVDVESQSGSLHPLFTIDGCSTTHILDKQERANHVHGDNSSHLESHNSKLDPALPGLADGPSRVFVHYDGVEDCVGILVTNEMIEITQNITSKVQILKKHQSSYDDIEKEILYAREQIEKARADLELAEEDTLQELQDFIELEEGNMQEAYERRDALGRRLEIFKSNLDFAQEASHTFLTQLLEKTGLLDLPNADDEVVATTEISTPDNDVNADAEEVAYNPEEVTYRAAARDELFQLTEDLEKAQEEFDGYREYYHSQKQVYKECVERGDLPDDQSDFDRKFQLYGQQLTRNLIDADEAYKGAKLRAVALRAVESDWGEPVPFGPLAEWEAQSSPANEYAAYQASRDWSRVEKWIQRLLALDDPNPSIDENVPEVDDWDAKSDDVWESVSVYDSVESSRDNIDRWEAIREYSRAKWNQEKRETLRQDSEEEILAMNGGDLDSGAPSKTQASE
ncbi:hypothetical protein P7C71_g4014, partial [Lecanoromycetidae sp. Uapishka_2]